MRPLTPTGALRAGWSLLMVLVAAALIAGAGIVYTAHEQAQADRRWCALLTTLDQQDAPPTTERGRQVQAQVHQLRAEFGCEG